MVNTAVVIILVNTKLKSNNGNSDLILFINRKYSDMSVSWFKNVGVSIVLNL